MAQAAGGEPGSCGRETLERTFGTFAFAALNSQSSKLSCLLWIGKHTYMNVQSTNWLTSAPPNGETAVVSMSSRAPFATDWEPDAGVDAPGKPGTAPTWTSSSKDAVGCSLGCSRLWFTLGYGIVNEVYWPRTDLPQIRDLGFVVADGNGFWSEVKRHGDYSIRSIAPGVPAFEIVHTHSRYVLASEDLARSASGCPLDRE